ncbi:MAG: peptidoglycan DD-metalloendopeptidase family protein [Eubacteriales bacterium]|nr:peptidoglycan DD-metalloendopeptidase family protein [Eubacteriales bacterium]MDD3200158.1 peptidoglycan DD-metalloendopeptidase family protein [Eubacteriales bacterium]MDD4122488.1 peptidoglycan DD-metalloendopeptidase family protein [Eubacteriales bacterium]MDD4629074.1 peptidoglycan DD-metalloendopeptidase family protein [Eubacteriales bacterium]
MKKLISYALIFALCASVITIGVTYADEQEELNDINSKINKTQSELNAGKKKEKQLSDQIKDLESKINATEKEIAEIKGDINKTEQNIAVVAANLVAAEAETAEQNDSLKKRLRAMYKNGDTGLVQILFGSESITDFMSNMDMIQKIYDYDVEVLKIMEEQCNKIELQKKELESLQAMLQSEKQREAERQASLQTNRGQVAHLKTEVAKSNAELEAQIDALNAEADRLIEEIRRLQGDGAYTGGEFAWPGVSTYVTSDFGMRFHPILKVNKLHTGIDIRAASGSKVMAANRGTVIKAGWNNSYGNVVMIDHGGEIVTLYAHNSKLEVKTGDVVSKGQTIALAGSTGNSTGPHIHFEVRVDGKYQDPKKWL